MRSSPPIFVRQRTVVGGALAPDEVATRGTAWRAAERLRVAELRRWADQCHPERRGWASHEDHEEAPSAARYHGAHAGDALRQMLKTPHAAIPEAPPPRKSKITFQLTGSALDQLAAVIAAHNQPGGGIRVLDVFTAADRDASGVLDEAECAAALERLGVRDGALVAALFREMGGDSGLISYRELSEMLRKKGKSLRPLGAADGTRPSSPRTERRALPAVLHARSQRLDALGVLPAAANQTRAVAGLRAEWKRRRVDALRHERRAAAEREPNYRQDEHATQACLRGRRQRTCFPALQPPAAGGAPAVADDTLTTVAELERPPWQPAAKVPAEVWQAGRMRTRSQASD